MKSISNQTMVLAADHPGFRDAEYVKRRNAIAEVALRYRHGDLIPDVQYTPEEDALWQSMLSNLRPLHYAHACREFLLCRSMLQLPEHRVPQLAEVSALLSARTGFQLNPVCGLILSVPFLRALERGIFLATQYVRHPSAPHFSPEPDVLHELIGHGFLLTNPAYARLSRKFGSAAACTDDPTALDQITRVYWYTVEVGVVKEDQALKVFGASLLSSRGELSQFRERDLQPLDLDVVADTPFDVTMFQSTLFVAESFDALVSKTHEWLDDIISGDKT